MPDLTPQAKEVLEPLAEFSGETIPPLLRYTLDPDHSSEDWRCVAAFVHAVEQALWERGWALEQNAGSPGCHPAISLWKSEPGYWPVAELFDGSPKQAMLAKLVAAAKAVEGIWDD